MNIDLPTEAIVLLSGQRIAQGQFVLFSLDVDGAEIAYSHYDQLRSLPDPSQNRAMMFHAATFVCAVRRVGRLLEAMVGSGQHFRPNSAKAIKLEWHKKRTFYNEFIEPRNAIEHIDSELKSTTRLRFFNMVNDVFEISEGKSVSINSNALSKVIESRDRIASAIVAEYQIP